eukprot:5603281-Prymnesium_polylepis.1
MGVPRSSSTGKVDYQVLRRLQRAVEGSARQMAGQRNHGQGHVLHHCASYLHDQKQQHDGDSTAQ